MTRFEYVSVFISILIALAIAEILSGWGQLIRLRGRVKPGALYILWSALVVLFLIQFWWGRWEYHGQESWSFIEFVMLVLPAVTAIILAFVMTPNITEQGEGQLSDAAFSGQKWFFLLVALVIVEVGVADSVIGVRPLFSIQQTIRFIALPPLVWLAYSSSRRLHLTLVIGLYVLLLLYVLVTYPVLA